MLKAVHACKVIVVDPLKGPLYSIIFLLHSLTFPLYSFMFPLKGLYSPFKPPGASYTVQGPHKQPGIMKTNLLHIPFTFRLYPLIAGNTAACFCQSLET